MRIKPSVWYSLLSKDPYLAAIYLGVRDLNHAGSELQWMKQELPRQKLRHACNLRSRGYPLQYILGSQPFGHFDIKCVPEVLIPRWETEEWAMNLATLLQDRKISDITALDLGTGTGCISLALSSGLKDSAIFGVDISDKALKVFEENIKRNKLFDLNNNKLKTLKFDLLHGNGLELLECVKIQNSSLRPSKIDLIVSNPPYIPKQSFMKETELSVKKYEPKLALLGNLEYYTAIINLASEVGVSAIVCEVGDQNQIDYSLKRGEDFGYTGVPINDSAGKPRLFAMWNDSSWSFLRNLIR